MASFEKVYSGIVPIFFFGLFFVYLFIFIVYLLIFVLHFFICFFYYYTPLPVYLPAKMIALRDDQITNAARLWCGRRHAWGQRSLSNVIFLSSSVVCTKQETIHEFLSSC